MDKETRKVYSEFAAFLALTLGPDYEVVVTDLGKKPRIAAVEGGSLSGNKVGGPVGIIEKQLEKEYRNAEDDWKINYSAVAGNGRLLRCSTMFIKDREGRLQGMLSINFDDSRYRDLSEKVFELCHPDAYAERNITVGSNVLSILGAVDDGQPQDDGRQTDTTLFTSVEAAVDAAVAAVTGRPGVPSDRLLPDEKQKAVRLLEKRGIFAIKGAVQTAAKKLGSSQASIYRYLSAARQKQEQQ